MGFWFAVRTARCLFTDLVRRFGVDRSNKVVELLSLWFLDVTLKYSLNPIQTCLGPAHQYVFQVPNFELDGKDWFCDVHLNPRLPLEDFQRLTLMLPLARDPCSKFFDLPRVSPNACTASSEENSEQSFINSIDSFTIIFVHSHRWERTTDNPKP